jgi:secreted Zn-dependent insulinase-like peptidase
MFAVCLGVGPLKELISKAVETYSDIRDKKATPITYIDRPLPYPAPSLKKIIKVTPLQQEHRLTVFFPLPHSPMDNSEH